MRGIRKLGIGNQKFTQMFRARGARALITVGGTVALKNEDFVLPPIKRHVKDYTVNRLPEIVITPLGEDTGIYGGIAIVLKFKP